MDKLPETLEELLDYIIENADNIHVREQIDGKWDNRPLSSLSVKVALKHAKIWIIEMRIPYILIPRKSQEI